MNKFRASYTVLSTWESGDFERAVKIYFKLENFITPQMAEGKNIHESWAKHIQETNTTPIEFGGEKLDSPKSEVKLVAQLLPWLEVVGIPDLIDNKKVYEFKTGKKSSEEYATSKQGGVYAILATFNDLLVDQVVIGHFDQYKKCSDISFVWVTNNLLKETLNWVETLSSEMHHYLEQNQLYQRFARN